MSNGTYLHKVKIPFINSFKLKILKFGVKKRYVVNIIKNEKQLIQSFKLRYLIYCKEFKYLDPEDFNDGVEKDIYDGHSTGFALIEKNTNELVGTVRLVRSNSLGLPIEKEFGLILNKINNNNNSVEISRLCITRNHRNRHRGNNYALLALLKAIYLYSIHNKFVNLFAAIDKNVFEMLKKYGFSFTILGTPKYYMGSESVPVLLNLENESMWLKIVNPLLWRFLNEW